jgi:ComF family protein
VAPGCAACGVPLDRPLDGPVCPACWAAVRPITPPACDACGDPLPSWRVISQARAVCARCRRTPRAVDRSRAVGVYDGALRAIIHAFKYDGRRGLAGPLAARMALAGAALLEGADCVVPVPLHRRRRRARGYNQAADLAARLPLPIVAALARPRATSPQAGLPAARRHANVRNAFALRTGWISRRAPAVRGRVVVLVDDVATTGATLEACARVLKAAGAREVRALTAARVVLGPPPARRRPPPPAGAPRR